MKQTKPVYLASKSPRRREILSLMGVIFDVATADADETIGRMSPAKTVEELSKRKAAEADVPDGELVVIGSDTVVALHGTILGKPKDKEDAKRMLRLLSGARHQVYTGVTVSIRGRKPKSITFHTKTDVSVDALTEAEIEAYVSIGEPMDKAGAYGIQGVFGRHIEKINGDYYNVMGLPMRDLYDVLKNEKILVP